MPATTNTIEIHLKTVEQLYNSLDPSPFHERDLDEKAERYIVGYARELRTRDQLLIKVTLPDSANAKGSASHIYEAIRNHFSYRAEMCRQDLRELIKIGWRFLAIGLVVLAGCYLAIQAMNLPASPTTWQRLVEQSLLILGWVANWRPIEIFLYDWLPLRRQMVLFDKLAVAQVDVQHSMASQTLS